MVAFEPAPRHCQRQCVEIAPVRPNRNAKIQPTQIDSDDEATPVAAVGSAQAAQDQEEFDTVLAASRAQLHYNASVRKGMKAHIARMDSSLHPVPGSMASCSATAAGSLFGNPGATAPARGVVEPETGTPARPSAAAASIGTVDPGAPGPVDVVDVVSSSSSVDTPSSSSPAVSPPWGSPNAHHYVTANPLQEFRLRQYRQFEAEGFPPDFKTSAPFGEFRRNSLLNDVPQSFEQPAFLAAMDRLAPAASQVSPATSLATPLRGGVSWSRGGSVDGDQVETTRTPAPTQVSWSNSPVAVLLATRW